MNQPPLSRVAAFCAAVLFSLATAHAVPVSIATVYVGDPGNVADSASNSGLGSSTTPGSGAGAVSYGYNIGKYDVTLTQYTAFLNAVAKSDQNNLYNPSMGTDGNIKGITQSGSSGSYSYSVIGSGQRPVTYVSWYDAARFANWLTNGQPTGAQGNGTTETGVYRLNGATSISGTLPTDHSALIGTGTKWFIPTENEWYKAAYYKGGNTNAGYWKYPFQSDTEPTNNITGSTPNSGNFYNGVYATTQSNQDISSLNYLTDVGAYTASTSPYGSYDMGGDVYQWNETLFNGLYRGLRGGFWNNSSLLPASTGGYGDTTSESFIGGFRVAELPEPSTITLFVLGAIGVWFASRRRRVKA